MFNADLALSVTMTAFSTLFSVITLPANLLIYSRLAYNHDVTSSIDWNGLYASLSVVISAIGLGLLASYHFNSHNFNLHANRLGNFAGVLLLSLSAVLSNSNANVQLWDRDWKFFVGVALPCLLGLLLSNLIASSADLLKPERVTVSIECVYQNVGIATSAALTMFTGTDLATAAGVPFYYGIVEMFFISIYCIGAWKCGWTKAPSNVPFWTSLVTSYEILSVEKAEKEVDGVLVERPGEPDIEFEYVEHSDAKGGTKEEEKNINDEINVEAIPPARREPLSEKGKKEPSFITV